MIYTIAYKFLPSLGWQYCVMENGVRIHHYATYTEALHVKESLERGNHQECFTPSLAFREGFNEEHFRAVMRAREFGLRAA
jgi:hypothetical protein